MTETGVIAMYIRERDRGREGDGNWAGWRESIYSSVGREAVAKTKIHTSRCTNTSLKRLILIYAVTDGDGGDAAWKHRQGCRWKCLTAEHLLNVKQHSRKMMVEISWDVVLICKSELMFSRTLQIKVRHLCFYDFCFFCTISWLLKTAFPRWPATSCAYCKKVAQKIHFLGLFLRSFWEPPHRRPSENCWCSWLCCFHQHEISKISAEISWLPQPGREYARWRVSATKSHLW